MQHIFSHSPLTNARTQIRLLYLLPNTDNTAPIEAQLQAFDKAGVPPFAAISYTWGIDGPSKTITVNGSILAVTRSCWYALWQVRFHGATLPVWIDSVCINQRDTAEKQAQVSHMHSIYTHACVTYCCVGPHARDSAWLCEMLVRQTMEREHQLVYKAPIDSQVVLNDSMKTASTNIRSHTSQDYEYSNLQHNHRFHPLVSKDFDRLHRAYKDFTNRPYWSRLWVLQEIVLSRRTEIWCDTVILKLEHLTQGTSLATRTMPNDTISTLHDIVELKTMTRALSANNSFDGVNPLLLLRILSRKLCSDSRDMIYGSLSMIPWAIIPDYTRSTYDVAAEAIERVLQFLPTGSLAEVNETAFLIAGRLIVEGKDPSITAKLLYTRLRSPPPEYLGSPDKTFASFKVRTKFENVCLSPLQINNGALTVQTTASPNDFSDRLLQKLPLLPSDHTEVDVGGLACPIKELLNLHGRLIGLTNIEAMSGDLLLPVVETGTPKLRRFLLLRNLELKYEILGQAILFIEEKLELSLYPVDLQELHLLIDMADLVAFQVRPHHVESVFVCASMWFCDRSELSCALNREHIEKREELERSGERLKGWDGIVQYQ